VLKLALSIAKSSRERRQAGLSIISGVHLVQSFRLAGGRSTHTLVSEDASERPEVRALLHDTEKLAVVKASLFTELAGLVQGGDIVEIIQTPLHPLPTRLSMDCVVLDQLQDPGNMGSILRSVASAGIRHVITTPGSAFVWSPKVLRAAMGAHFALHMSEGFAWSEVRPRITVPVVATCLDGAASLFATDLKMPVCWVFGNEGAGVSKLILADAERKIRIPMSQSVESLNVAASVAVCLFEQRRQRLMSSLKPE
jgi:RNA methyltransferase, TrmH family